MWGQLLANFGPKFGVIFGTRFEQVLELILDQFWGNFGVHFGIEDKVKTGINVKTWLFQIYCKNTHGIDFLRVRWNSFRA